MALFEPKSLTRIAEALEGLLRLYKRDLEERSIFVDIPNPEGEGEIFDTDDARVAELIARTVANKPIPARDGGFFVESPEETWKTPRPEEENYIGWVDSSVFGSRWGLNSGPEGAEEDRGGSHSYGSPPQPAPRDVPEQGSSPESEGTSGSDRSPQP